MPKQLKELLWYDANQNIAYLTYSGADYLLGIMQKNDPEIRVQNEANLDNLLEIIKSRYNNKSTREEMMACKAAHLLYRLAWQSHAFVNGNKRMAFLLTTAFLFVNGYEVPPGALVPEPDSELARFILELAGGKVSLNKTIKWMRKNMRKGTMPWA